MLLLTLPFLVLALIDGPDGGKREGRLKAAREMKLWLVFDMNGTLISKHKKTGKFKLRPGLRALRRLRDSGHFRLALWSSAKRGTIEMVLEELESAACVKFERILHRAHTLSADAKLRGNEWDTIKPLRPYFGSLERVMMIDDSQKAAPAEERNWVQVPTWDHRCSDDTG
eukprot:jgi/Bigna1/62179/fgenesh1_kg.31_\